MAKDLEVLDEMIMKSLLTETEKPKTMKLNNIMERVQQTIDSDVDLREFNIRVDSDIEEFILEYTAIEVVTDDDNADTSQCLVEIFNEIADEIKSNRTALMSGCSVTTEEFDKMSLKTIFNKLRCKCSDRMREMAAEYKRIRHEMADALLRQDQQQQQQQQQQHVDQMYNDMKRSLSARWSDTLAVSTVVSEDSLAIQDPNEFLGYKQFAIKFVDDLLNEAVERTRSQKKTIRFKLAESAPVTLDIMQTTIKDFTPRLGQIIISDFLSSWQVKKGWLYCIDFVAEQSDSCSDFYVYEAKWSVPTDAYPVPQVTVSVFFKIEASRTKPPTSFVKVTYAFEGKRSIYSPRENIQHMMFLEDILKCKLAFFKTLHF